MLTRRRKCFFQGTHNCVVACCATQSKLYKVSAKYHGNWRRTTPMQLVNLETPPSLRIHSGCHQGRGYWPVWTLAGASVPVFHSWATTGITAKLEEIWPPPVKPFDLASQETVSDRALKYKHTKRGLQILPAVLVRIFPGQRIQIFSDAEPQAVRHSMSCLFHSMTSWNRSCKYSKRQEQVQPFIHQKAAPTPRRRSPTHGTVFIQHLQCIRKDTPSRLMGHKLGRGNLRAKSHLHLLGHPCHTDHCNLRCCNKQIMLTNLSCHQTWQTSRKTQQNHLSTPQLSHANHPKHIHWQLMLEGSEKNQCTHKEQVLGTLLNWRSFKPLHSCTSPQAAEGPWHCFQAVPLFH